MEPENAESYYTMIKNILTLRYDPSQESSRPRLNPDDFEEREDLSPKSIESTIQNAIQSKLGSDQSHVAVALSGGIDSVLVTALLRQAYPNMKIDAVSVRFADSYDESELASRIAEKFDANHHVIPIENYLEELPAAVGISKMPFWDIHWYYVVEKSSHLSDTLVSGDGGDELFGGYTFRYAKFLSGVKNNKSPEQKAQLYLECHQRDWVPDQQDVFGEKIYFSWSDIYKMISPYFDNSLCSLNQVFLADYNGKLLYNWIPLNTSFHEYFGVSSVTPILSEDLVSKTTHIPATAKYDRQNNIGKLHLRQLLANYIPGSLLTKRKQGFSVSTTNLWNGFGFKLCDYYLSSARTTQDRLISKEWIDKHFPRDGQSIDVRYVNKFLGLLALEVWYRIFITHEMKSDEKLTI